jgi:hypothetical protein
VSVVQLLLNVKIGNYPSRIQSNITTTKLCGTTYKSNRKKEKEKEEEVAGRFLSFCIIKFCNSKNKKGFVVDISTFAWVQIPIVHFNMLCRDSR